MSRITLRQLEYFRAIAATGSLSAAAEREHVARSTIAAALSDLERGLDTKLCTRHKARGIELTESGKALLDAALAVGAYVDDIEAIASPLQGVLTLGCFGSLAPTIMPGLLKRFAAEHPRVEVITETGSTDELVDLLTMGRLDLVISYKLHTEPTLVTRALYETRMHAVLPSNHALAEERVVDARKLVGEPLVMMTTPPSERDVAEYFASLGVSPTIRFRVSHFEFGRSLIAAGLGYGLYIQRPSHDLTYDGAPVTVRPIHPTPPVEVVSIGWSRKARPSAKARAFVELTQSVGADLAPTSLYDGIESARTLTGG